MPDISDEPLDTLTSTTAGPQVMPYTRSEITAPVIVSLGRQKKKALKQLKRGKGRAMDEVMDAVAQVQANLGEQTAGKIILPVVVIYRLKQRRPRTLF